MKETSIEEEYYQLQHLNWAGPTGLVDPTMVEDLMRTTANLARMMKGNRDILQATLDVIWEEVQITAANLETLQLTNRDARQLLVNLHEVEAHIGQLREARSKQTTTSPVVNDSGIPGQHHHDDAA